jgi:outer membrane protein assembly factor BamB
MRISNRNPFAIHILAGVIFVHMAGLAIASDDWSRFRGPNGSGVAIARGLPLEFGPDKNVIWKTELPPGHSSPILTETRIFLTAFEGENLLTICIERTTGKILWQKQVTRDRQEKLDQRNNPASPSPATDGENVYVFFADYGLISYDLAGNKRWQLPLGPFNNIYGMGASPIVADDKIVLVCDQNTNSFLIGVGKDDGQIKWKTDRPEATSGHSTPILYKPQEGGTQVIVPGSFYLTGYSVSTGKKVWWVRGLSFEMKSTPVLHEGVAYINGYATPLNQPGKQVVIPPFEEVSQEHDADKSGDLSIQEMPDKLAKSFFSFLDLNGDSTLNRDEWNYFRAAMETKNGMLAIRVGGHGDMTETNILWQYHRSVPQLPSPLFYKNILYMVNDGGIVTSFNPANGEVFKQGRLRGAVDAYYASPIAADDKIFMIGRSGKVSVLKPDGSLEVLAVNDLKDQCYATPAISDNRIYLRTRSVLYCFGI